MNSGLDILRDLCRLPHRGAATPYGAEAARLLQTYLTDREASVRTEPFQTPKTYVTVVYWLIGGLLTGLVLVPVTGVAVGFVWYFAWMAWRYFNWRYAFVTRFPVQHTAHNVIGYWPAHGAGENRRKVILMAHYDTAPVSLLYGPKQQASFRVSLIISLSLMGLACVVAVLEVAAIGLPYITYLRYGLMAYFVVQALTGTVGYWLKGYANGASDNATGVVAALTTADRLCQANLPGVEVEVALVSSEEVGYIGSYTYFQQHRRSWPGQTAVINFDTLGAGKLTVIEQTGTLETLRYDNPLTNIARQLIAQPDFGHRAQMGRWHTADFDSIWFVRAGFPTLALCALDADGRMPRIHQPTDTLDAVDTTPMHDAIDLAEAVVRQWVNGYQ